jgi:hypothetical protein
MLLISNLESLTFIEPRARPMLSIISEFDSITGVGEADIAIDKISELSIHISLIIIIYIHEC